MAESDPSTQSGSDMDQADGHTSDGSPRRVPNTRGGKKLIGSVRALAIKKVGMWNEPLPLLDFAQSFETLMILR